MKILCKFFFTLLFIGSFFNANAQTTACNLTGGSVYVAYTAPPIMMNATVNGMSQYSYSWTNGASANQNQFYNGWCVTITDLMTGCDTIICESCIPTGGSGMCPMIYNPVCGCDGTIYSNDCIAMQNGIFTFTSAIGPNGQLLPCTQPTTCQVEIDGDSIICNLGNPQILVASPTASSNPFVTYLWSTGQTGPVLTITTPGTYCVTATDSTGCVDSECFTVSAQDIAIYSTPSPPIICLGDTIALEFWNTPLTNIVWMPTGDTTHMIHDNPNSSTTYIVEGIDVNGCDRRGEITVDVSTPQNLNIYSVPNPPNICLGDSIVLEASLGFMIYSWNNSMTVDRIVDFPTQDTWYLVEAVDSNGCVVHEDILVYVDTCTTSIINLLSAKVNIYPNPSNAEITIRLTELETFDLEVYDVIGNQVYFEENVFNKKVISKSILSSGTYLIKIKSQEDAYFGKLVFY